MTDEDCLKLTTYCGERDRHRGRLIGDALLELYGEHRPAASILLRGVEGFGRLHHLRSDRLLSLSEDLPLVTYALDRRNRIEALLGPVAELMQRGLITVERARLLTGSLSEVRLPEELHEGTKLTVYVGRRQRAGGVPAYVAICDLLHRRGIAGATTLLGVDGTLAGDRTRARFFARNADVPMMVISVGAGDRIAAVLSELEALLGEPLVTLERVQLCKRDGELLSRPRTVPALDDRGLALWQKLQVYTSQAATVRGRALNLEIIRRLRASDSAGATSVRGLWGFHGAEPPHGDRFLQLRRRVPVVTTTVDTPQRAARAFEIIDELTAEHGLVTCETVPALRAMSAQRTVGGFRLASA